jgi:hypothetical protein
MSCAGSLISGNATQAQELYNIGLQRRICAATLKLVLVSGGSNDHLLWRFHRMFKSKIRGRRWWSFGLLMFGPIINVLTRSSLALALTAMRRDPAIPFKGFILNR